MEHITSCIEQAWEREELKFELRLRYVTVPPEPEPGTPTEGDFWVASLVDLEESNTPLFDPLHGEITLVCTGKKPEEALEALNNLCDMKGTPWQ
jgi:hypothetical protein